MKNGNLRICKKLTSVMLCIIMVAVMFACSFVNVAAKEKEYIIDNPYQDVNWDTWNAYKTQLHCHTTASDGYLTIQEFVQKYYDANYDIVALTDHGTLNRGWNNEPQLVPLMRLIKKERTNMADVIPLTDEDYNAVISGTAASETRTHQNGMLDVPLGIELNMATPIADCHLTGYFAEYGQGLAGVYGDYETPSKGVKDAGGISMLSHVGEYVYTDKDSADHVGQPVDDYYANKFARIFLDNAGSSLGMGINSASDAHTRCDRILYDQILQKTIPNGVLPWGFSFSDSHDESSLNDAYTMMYMDEFTMDSFRESMENGTFFSVSHFSNGYELNGMAEMPGFDEQYVYDNKTYLLDNTPMVTKVSVNEKDDTITVEGINFDEITWVSDGNVILRESDIENGRATLDLHSSSLLDDPYMYVRFYITGDNGICYSQPFVLNVEGEEFEPVEVPATVDTPYYLRMLVTILDWMNFKFNPVVWLFKYFGLGYNVFDNFFNAY